MNSKITRRAARIISNILVPPSFLIITFSIIIIFYEEPIKMPINFFNALLFGFLLPILIFIILHKNKLVADVDATEKAERNLPYLIGLFLSILALFISIYFELNIFAIALWTVYSIIFIPLILINRFWKISAHAIGASVPFAVFLYWGDQLYILFFIILIFVGLSRIILEKHNFTQVLAGSILGIFITILTFKLIAG